MVLGDPKITSFPDLVPYGFLVFFVYNFAKTLDELKQFSPEVFFDGKSISLKADSFPIESLQQATYFNKYWSLRYLVLKFDSEREIKCFVAESSKTDDFWGAIQKYLNVQY